VKAFVAAAIEETLKLESALARLHAHRGQPEGTTSAGVPVFNVALPLLRRRFPDRPPFRIVEVPFAEEMPVAQVVSNAAPGGGA